MGWMGYVVMQRASQLNQSIQYIEPLRMNAEFQFPKYDDDDDDMRNVEEKKGELN